LEIYDIMDAAEVKRRVSGRSEHIVCIYKKMERLRRLLGSPEMLRTHQDHVPIWRRKLWILEAEFRKLCNVV